MIKILVTLAALTATAFAQTGSYKSEYDRLQKGYEAAIKRALEPIQKRQADALEQLVRKATQAGDLETAVTAKQTLDQIAPKPAAMTQNATTGASKRATLTANLASAKWAVFDTPTQKRIDTQIFNADGTCTGRLSGKWEALTGNTIKVSANAQTYDGTINDSGTQIDFGRIGRTMRKE
jgi:hypothetical protein